MEQILKISGFILDSFIHIWPYLLITIPLAVVVQITGAAKYINKAFSYNPVVSIVLATLVGAFSPFCSCGVIPVITALLIGGVPLAPVMSFWIASPSMDPEIFLLSTSVIGWKLSVWRLGSTLIMSLLSGFITHFAIMQGWLGKNILREQRNAPFEFKRENFITVVKNHVNRISYFANGSKKVTVQFMSIDKSKLNSNVNCCIPIENLCIAPAQIPIKEEQKCSCVESKKPVDSFRERLLLETWKATIMVIKFMTLAFLVNAIIQFYVPQDKISNLLGGNGSAAVITATLIGVPFYTSNITALPLISGLLSLGMNQGAALAFLIAGPVTTLPAMVAVFGIVRRKIFFLYISFALIGAVLSGILFNLFY